MFRIKKYHIQSLPKTIRRQFAPGPGMIEPALPSRTKLVRVRVDRACLWSVCKSTSFAMCLIVIGATMAVMGFYAPELSSHEVVLGNSTYTSVNTNAHWHLKNLTYVGPAFMGLGSVIIVAICVMTFEARDKAAKICPEDPPKPSKDELCVNVIKNLVRKYSGVPKIVPQIHEEREDARLIPIYSANCKPKRKSHFLETPVDYSLSTRCSSEPCFTANRNSANLKMQLPVVHITSSDSPPPDLGGGLRSSHPEEDAALNASVPVNLLLHQVPDPSNGPPKIDPATSGSSGLKTRRQSTVSGEIVVDIHPLPSSCGHEVDLPLKADPSAPGVAASSEKMDC